MTYITYAQAYYCHGRFLDATIISFKFPFQCDPSETVSICVIVKQYCEQQINMDVLGMKVI